MFRQSMMALGAVAMLAAAASGGAAVAATATCPAIVPNPIPNDLRVVTLTTDTAASCLGTGLGNDSLADVQAFANAPANLVLIDKSDDATSGDLEGALTGTDNGADNDLTTGTAGTFNIAAPGFKDFVLVFKFGNGRRDPDWHAFLLPLGVVSGSWAVNGSQALSHASLYGVVDDMPQPIPLPAAAWMLLAGLGSLAALRRKRTT